MSSAEAASFTLAERALLRGALYVRFGQPPSLADGIWLRTWRGGLQAGQAKIPSAVASMLARGLLELRPARIGLAAYFTETGFAALRLLAQDRRALNPTEFAHVRQQLGLDPVPTEPPGYPQKPGVLSDLAPVTDLVAAGRLT